MATAFVGPLSRWFGSLPGAAPVAQVRAGVEAWRRDLRQAVAARVQQELEWDEGKDVSFRADFGGAGFMALRLFAFYAERADLELPDTVPPVLELDAAFRAAADQKFDKSLYGQLLACRVWLPGEFPVTLRAPLPDGDAAEIGSLVVLADQMLWLNQRTFDADAATIASWRELDAPSGGDLLAAARRGYATLLAAIDVARRHDLPLLVDET